MSLYVIPPRFFPHMLFYGRCLFYAKTFFHCALLLFIMFIFFITNIHIQLRSFSSATYTVDDYDDDDDDDHGSDREETENWMACMFVCLGMSGTKNLKLNGQRSLQ